MEKGRAMASKTLDLVTIDIEDDGNGGDDEVQFISQIEAAEALALSIKRRRFTTLSTEAISAPSPPSNFSVKSEKPDGQPEVEEGAYMAALKGSKSQLWQKNALSTSNSSTESFGRSGGGGGGGGGSYGGGGGDACFKCGKIGHWARDCDSGNYSAAINAPAEKSCPCGIGICSVLTANTERNRGRNFYKCPVREENGGCGFFEWCDKTSATNSFAEGSLKFANSFVRLVACVSYSFSLVSIERARYNVDQQFSHRPANQGSSDFAKSSIHQTLGGASSEWMNESNGKSSSSLRTGSTCFKCNKEGHWARDCQMASSNSSPNSTTSTRGNSFSSGSCYKCGKPGHWARDCPQSQVRQVQKW
ncbi:hypothetical protein Dimus_009958 [Dionaea muscipula]